MGIDDLLLREWNLLLMASVWVVMSGIERAMPAQFVKGALMNRIEPLVPIGVCVFAACFVPGPWMPDETELAQRVILGVLLGAGAYNFGAVAKRLGITSVVLGVGAKKP